jgi:methionyl-tRNA formyltransferase
MEHTLLNGDARTGVTIIDVSPRIDAGRILLQQQLDVTVEDNLLSCVSRAVHFSRKAFTSWHCDVCRRLTSRLGQIGADMTLQVLADLENLRLQGQEQVSVLAILACVLVVATCASLPLSGRRPRIKSPVSCFTGMTRISAVHDMCSCGLFCEGGDWF